MTHRFLALVFIATITFQCRQKEVKGEFAFAKKEAPRRQKASETINLVNKGVGPINSVVLNEEIDSEMAERGKQLYETKCLACHKLGATFIGPPPNAILERRTPEWVMNMILNPEGMLEKDSVAKALFMEFNGQIMTNQQLAENEARDILEYFRTLEPLKPL
ncbi:MAG: cytochrome c [Bacteroidota bacterium]